MKIAGRKISENKPPFVIAELSANHNNDIKRTLKIIKEAKKVGADAIKLQTFTAESITLDSSKKGFIIKDKQSLWNNKKLFDLYKEAALPRKWYKEIFNEAKKNNLICFSSPFDEQAVEFLEKFNVPAFKIASFENNHYPLISKVFSKKKPTLISLGATEFDEILNLVRFIKKKKFKNFALLHCSSSYPAKIEESNIKTILDLKKRYKFEIGYSDHTQGIGAAIAAVSYGASIVEKHFTLDKQSGGLDDSFSSDPNEFLLLVQEIKKAWLSLGKINYRLTKSEKRHKIFKRSIYICNDIKKDERFTKNNIRIVRPSSGLDPKYYNQIIGKKSTKNLKFANPLKKKDINF